MNILSSLINKKLVILLRKNVVVCNKSHLIDYTMESPFKTKKTYSHNF